ASALNPPPLRVCASASSKASSNLARTLRQPGASFARESQVRGMIPSSLPLPLRTFCCVPGSSQSLRFQRRSSKHNPRSSRPRHAGLRPRSARCPALSECRLRSRGGKRFVEEASDGGRDFVKVAWAWSTRLAQERAPPSGLHAVICELRRERHRQPCGKRGSPASKRRGNGTSEELPRNETSVWATSSRERLQVRPHDGMDPVGARCLDQGIDAAPVRAEIVAQRS